MAKRYHTDGATVSAQRGGPRPIESGPITRYTRGMTSERPLRTWWATHVFFIIFRPIMRAWLRVHFGIRIDRGHDRRLMRGPLVVVATHVNWWDPFLVGVAFRRPVAFLSADGNFRTVRLRSFMRLAGAVPKAKARTDMESIRAFQRLAAAGGIVAVFPEGQRTWDGRTRPLLPGIEKLVRLLGAPVAAVRLKGAYLSTPRWASNNRRGRIEIEVRMVADRAGLRAIGRVELRRRIAAALEHDEAAWQRDSGVIFRSRERAAGIEHVLWHCPACGGWGTLRGCGSEIVCNRCGDRSWYAPSGRLYGVLDGLRRAGRFTRVAEWHAWQRAALEEALAAAPTAAGPLPIAFSDVALATGHRSRPVCRLGRGTVTLTDRAIELHPSEGAPIGFGIAELSGIHVQFIQQLEFYARGRLWVVRPDVGPQSAYRLEQTLLALQRNFTRA